MSIFGEHIIKRKNSLRKFLNELPYKKEINHKLIKYFSNDNPDDFYLVYPYFFYKVFFKEGSPNGYLDKVCNAGFLMYKHVYINDSVYDEQLEKKSKEKSFEFFLSQLFHEESIKILSSLFPMNSEFWELFNIRRFELYSSIQLDQAYKHQEFELDWKEYEKLAENKSAIAKVAIDIWFLLSEKKHKKQYDTLIKSHAYFSVGFQILDDIIDFENDLVNPQFNIGLLLLKKELAKRGEAFEGLSNNELHKLFYVYNITEVLINKAEKYFDKSIDVLGELTEVAPYWLRLINIKKKEALLLRLNIEAYFNKLLSKSSFSKSKNKNLQQDPLKPAVDFIMNAKEENDLFYDFWNNAGMSNIWSTSFVAYNLADYLRAHNQEKSLTTTVQQLSKLRQGERQLWGYNDKWISDADSTTSALLALMEFNIDMHQDLKLWLDYQNEDGGFATYNKDEELYQSLNFGVVNTDGWSNSHVCVSALAFYLFAKSPKSYIDANQDAFLALRKFILTNQLDNHLWGSYWWDSLIYSSSFVLRALHANGEQELAAFKNGLEAVAQLVGKKSCLCNSFQEESAFFTALALSVFCLDQKIYDAYQKPADQCYNYLLENQYEDGSFPESYIMRIPSPGITQPDEEEITWHKKHKGTMIILNDFMRIFTTSAVVNAIWSYKKLHR